MKDAYPKGLKWNCKRAYSCAALAKRNKCGKKYVQAMSRSCSNQIPKWFQNQVVNKFCKKSCMNCIRKYIAIHTFEFYSSGLHNGFEITDSNFDHYSFSRWD